MLLRTQLEERQETPTQGIGRNPYMRDKARILHSAFFRRLQAKKQIHDVDVSDFGRTRLTHTLEVAQIATGIREVLNKKNVYGNIGIELKKKKKKNRKGVLYLFCKMGI